MNTTDEKKQLLQGYKIQKIDRYPEPNKYVLTTDTGIRLFGYYFNDSDARDALLTQLKYIRVNEEGR